MLMEVLISEMYWNAGDKVYGCNKATNMVKMSVSHLIT